MAQGEMINKGMAQVYTGLGILLGAGRISSATHEQILALINSEQGPTTAAEKSNVDVKEGLPRPGKDTPISAGTPDLLGVEDDFVPPVVQRVSWGDATQPTTQKRPAVKEPAASTTTKIICPWWSTEGYSCRDYEKGKCPMLHEDIPDGLRDPLICHFWADGGRCTKGETACRFAHYPAQHRMVAPMPTKKKGKKARPGPAGGDWRDGWGDSPARAEFGDANEW
ncbi:hypothetical protein F5Y05DRAFT_260897 [Hypoxylon sp. FL0543]|nr:hypothetical protein F5Y05DRAFT_260897 [Hypoxylon sp. FL0543]